MQKKKKYEISKESCIIFIIIIAMKYRERERKRKIM